ncbi:MAG TPA: FG-GAP repeat protein [bacterium]|nr:FG-GAP repeat protein [bacterium]
MKIKVCLSMLLSILVSIGGVALADETPTTDAEVTIIGAQDDMIGSVLAVGDFNGDQAPDLFLGAPGG